jgi:transcriptional regulator with XRE-family HTH domain
MNLSEKVKHLRALEGSRRGHDRPLTQSEVSRLMDEELGQSVSQAYVSQIEKGARRHLTAESRMLLARFFRVHPGYLVDDPEGFTPMEFSDPERAERHVDEWLRNGAEKFRADPELSAALLTLSHHADSRRCLLLAAEMIRTAGIGALKPTLKVRKGNRRERR